MERTMIVTTPALSGMIAMMHPTMFASQTLDAPNTAVLWATAVWGTKPASDPNSPLNLVTNSFLHGAVETARYGNN
jgi:hypothetical protein